LHDELQCRPWQDVTVPKPPPQTLSVVSSGTANSTSPPGHLEAPGRRLWDGIQAEFNITDTAGLTLLFEACASVDTAEAIAAAVRQDGAVIYARSGVPRSHPGIKDMLGARALACRLLERLGVTTEAVQPPGVRRDSSRGRGWIPE
jgi:hypothetical protein